MAAGDTTACSTPTSLGTRRKLRRGWKHCAQGPCSAESLPLKKIVLNLIRLDTTDTSKTSLRIKRKAAGGDDDFRASILGLIRR